MFSGERRGRFARAEQPERHSEKILSDMEKKSRARQVAAAFILVVGMALVVGIVFFGLDRDAAKNKDYLEYWSAEQLLAHGQNPYDWNATLKLEREVGFNDYPALMSLSPPTAMFFLLPLGWVSANTGLICWTLVLMACTLASVWLIWLTLGKPDTRYHVIGIFFPPVLRCIMAGQIGIFLLLEIALFFYLQKSRPFWAGAALVFFSLKPHLVLPCLLVLVLWSIYKREYRILAGFSVAFAVSVGLTLVVDPRIWSQYREMTRTSPIMDELLPTASIWLRFLIAPKARWIEFIPEVAGCIWAIWYFWTRRDRWDWIDHGMLLLVVAVACSPYSWYTDQAVLLPPVVAGLNESERSRSSLGLFALVAGAGLVALVIDIKLLSGFFAWTAPAWLLWYAYARLMGRGRANQRVSELAG
jgi:Glycosyltransferase family 87